MKQLLVLMVLVVSGTTIFAQTSAQKKEEKQHAMATKVMYQCPTHPEVVSSKPGVCAKCGKKFEVGRKSSKQTVSVAYHCQMHPEVVSNEAGKCPKCGKDLEKEKSAEKH